MNKSSIIYRLLICLLLITAIQFHANGNETNSPIKEETWKKVSKGKSYIENYRERDKEELKEEEKDIDLNIPESSIRSFGQLFKILFIIILIIGLAFLVFYILKRFFNFFEEKVPQSQVFSEIVDNLEENIHDSEFDTLLKRALEEKQFKMAIRIYYLWIIKTLSDKNIIVWKRDKTNGQYVLEMIGKDGYTEFSDLTLIYEKVWFGNQPITDYLYHHFAPRFNNFITKLD